MIYREMTRTLRAAAALAAGLLLGACGDSSLLSPDTGAEIIIRSAGDGQTVGAADKIVFALAGGRGADRLAVTVASADGTTIDRTTIDDPQPDSSHSIDLASVAPRPGEYRARFVLTSDGATVAEKALVFFVRADGARLNGIESRPSIIACGAPVELSVVLAAGQDGDPFLRWTENNRTFASGLASAGGARARWTAPGEPGVYTIRVEMFPVAPATGAAFPFVSSVRTSTELYVTAPRRTRSLGPASSYWMLYELDGSLRDAVRDAVEAEPVGAIEAAAVGDAVGYRLAAPAGIRISRSVVPEAPAAGFTLSLGLALSAVEPGAVILESGSGRNLLRIALGPDGSPFLLLRSDTGEETLQSGAPALRAGDRHHLDLTFARSAVGMAAMWFLDGEPGAVTGVEDEGRLAAAGAGGTLIGGPNGMAGLIDELGVYCRDSEGRAGPDPAVYLRAMTLRHSDALLFADGFDGAKLDEGYRTEGDVSVALGKLVLRGPSSVELALNRPRSGGIVLEVVTDREIAVGWEGSTLRLSAGAPLAAQERIRVRISPQEGGAAGAGGYRLALANASDGPLSIESLLAYAE